MRERIFRVQYCDDSCDYPKEEWCFRVSRNSVSSCARCVVKEITKDWICDDCGHKFDKFVEYFEWYEALGTAAYQKTIPAAIVVRKLCMDCYQKRSWT